MHAAKPVTRWYSFRLLPNSSLAQGGVGLLTSVRVLVGLLTELSFPVVDGVDISFAVDDGVAPPSIDGAAELSVAVADVVGFAVAV